MAVATAPGLQKLSQNDFSAGAWPLNENVPPNGCEDIVNGIIDEDGSILRRGGSAYIGSLAGSSNAFVSAWSGYLGTTGGWTIASRNQSGAQEFWTLAANGSDFVNTWSDVQTIGAQRASAVNGMVIFAGPAPYPDPGVSISVWGGQTQIGVNGQTVTLVHGSKTVTGTGTSWLTTVKPGMILERAADDTVFVVESVQSNTSLTLLNPPISDFGGPMDFVRFSSRVIAKDSLPAGSDPVYTSAIFGRLVIARGGRVTFTNRSPFGIASTDYHQLPAGAAVVGMEPLRDQLLVFSTHGVFSISGMAYSLTDPAGNPQQRLQRIAPDVILWSNLGIAAWRGSLVAPCVDDIYLIGAGASMQPIGGGIRRLYRSYVRAGHVLGQATVHKSRYFLPVLSGVSSQWIDTLVCDLRTGAWTRWGGQGAQIRAATQRIGDNARQPQLVALGYGSSSTPRVLDLTGTLDPQASNKNDADGSTHQLTVMTRTFSLGDLVQRQWRKFRARYEMDDAATDNPTLSLYYATGRPGSSFTAVTGSGVEGDQTVTWPFSKHSRAIRFWLSQSSASSWTRLRQFEVFFRPSGRR